MAAEARSVAERGVGVAAAQEADGSGHARYTYRLRVSATARAALFSEWNRCRWVRNESVARSKRAHTDGEDCGPARLDRMLTEARAVTPCGWPGSRGVCNSGWGRPRSSSCTRASRPAPARAVAP